MIKIHLFALFGPFYSCYPWFDTEEETKFKSILSNFSNTKAKQLKQQEQLSELKVTNCVNLKA